MKISFKKLKNMVGLEKKEIKPKESKESKESKSSKEVLKLQNGIVALQKDIENFGSQAELEDALKRNPTIAEHIVNNITFCATALTGMGVLGLAAFVTKEASEKNLNSNLTGFIILGLMALGNALVYGAGRIRHPKEN